MQSVDVLKTQTAMLLSCKHYVLMICFNKPVRDHQTCKKKKQIKFRIFQFCPTFDMLYLNVYLVQKCKKHLCCICFRLPHRLTGLVLGWSGTRLTGLVLSWSGTRLTGLVLSWTGTVHRKADILTNRRI